MQTSDQSAAAQDAEETGGGEANPAETGDAASATSDAQTDDIAGAVSEGGLSESGPGAALNAALDTAQPLITGAPAVLWAGVASILIVMALIFFLMMRGRAKRSAQTSRTEFFEPAGEDAVIEFEDEEWEAPQADDRPRVEDNAPDVEIAEAAPGDRPGKRKPGQKPFSRLFGRPDAKQGATAADDRPSQPPAPEEIADVEIIQDTNDFYANKNASRQAQEEAAEIRAQAERDAEDLRARVRTEAEQQAREEAARQTALAADQRRAEAEQWRLEKERLEAERRKLNARAADLDARERAAGGASLKAGEDLTRSIDERFARLSEAIERRLPKAGEISASLAASLSASLAAMAPAARPDGERGGEDDIAGVLQNIEEALVAQSEALKAETRALFEDFDARFGRRLTAAEDRIESRLSASLKTDDQGAFGLAAPAAFASGAALRDDARTTETIEELARQVSGLIARAFADHEMRLSGLMDAALNASLNASLDARLEPSLRELSDGLVERLSALGGQAGGDAARALHKELAALNAALGRRTVGASAPRVQLMDIVQDALPPDAYEMNAPLPNNRRADCLVRLPFPPGPIAVDAQFPVEAFDRLYSAPEDAVGRAEAENEFRRQALRHVVDIAERLVAPGEAANGGAGALLFLPSETMYADLHARFPEIVQDAQRARVWIVSPTTLMATLHAMRAVLGRAASAPAAPGDADADRSAEAGRRQSERALHEVADLRQRLYDMETTVGNALHRLDAGAAQEQSPPEHPPSSPLRPSPPQPSPLRPSPLRASPAQTPADVRDARTHQEPARFRPEAEPRTTGDFAADAGSLYASDEGRTGLSDPPAEPPAFLAGKRPPARENDSPEQ